MTHQTVDLNDVDLCVVSFGHFRRLLIARNSEKIDWKDLGQVQEPATLPGTST